MPDFYLFGGPHGAGKTTIALKVLPRLGCREFINADSIAAALSPFHPETVHFQAGSLLIRRMRELMRQGQSFATEMTYAASHSAPLFMADCRAAGYRVHLIYLWLPTAEMAVRRVAARVRAGGSGVPEETIRRRYEHGGVNFLKIYRPLADWWACLDNSGELIVPVAQGQRGQTANYDAVRWLQIAREAGGNGATGNELDGEAMDEEKFGILTTGAQLAVTEAIERHRRLGGSVVVWRDGQIVTLTGDEIPRQAIETTH